MKLQFTKMHGLGNDFVVIDNRDAVLKNARRKAQKLCDRRTGIGADQLLLLEHSKTADFKMRIFNPDGSEVEMCGNGIRCIGKFIWDNILGGTGDAFARRYQLSIKSLAIETIAGVIHIEKTSSQFKVDMGEPVLEPAKIPLNTKLLPQKFKGGVVKELPLKINGKTFRTTCVSMGNPHAIIVVKNIQSIKLDNLGPLIENHKLFPNRTNVEFIQINDSKNITMKVWERGAGETMACGTGASASAVASIMLGLTDRKVTVQLPGGKLLINWSAKDNHVYMTGKAVTVYEGEIEL